MSKLLDTIEYEQTGRRFAKMLPMQIYSVDSEKITTHQGLDEYRLYVKLNTHVRLEYPCAVDGEVMRRARAYLANHVFGEFRGNIMEAREAMLNWDRDVALKWLDDMERRMFAV